jgi:hypothetical protein
MYKIKNEVEKMEIICASFEEVVYRVDMFGDAVTQIDWHRNAVKVAVPREDVFARQERAIRNIMKRAGGDAFGY